MRNPAAWCRAALAVFSGKDLHLDGGSVDVVISNCVINLPTGKAAPGLHSAIIRAVKPTAIRPIRD